MSDHRLGVDTVLLGTRVSLAVYHERPMIRIANPPSPTVVVFDDLVTGLIRERANVRMPEQLRHEAPEALAEGYFTLLRAFAARIQTRGSFQSHAPDLLWSEEVSVDQQDADSSILALLTEAGQTVIPAPLNKEGIAIGTHLSVQRVTETLAALVEQRMIEQTEEGYQLPGTTMSSPWMLNVGSTPQEIGLPVRMLRVMLGGPGDIKEEVDRARIVLEEWNVRNAEHEGVVLSFKHWSLHTYSNLEGRPQASINTQLVNRADLLVAVFWNRLGTETGQDLSGTVEEIRQFRESGRPAMLFFASRPVPQELLADEEALKQYRALQMYRKDIEKGDVGLYWTHRSVEEFATGLERQLTLKVRDLQSQQFRYSAQGFQGQQIHLEALRTEMKTFKRAFEEQASAWEVERSSRGHRMSEGKLILRRYSSMVSSHRARLLDDLSEQATGAWSDFLTSAKALEQTPETLGQDNFWQFGDHLFEATRTWLKHLQSTL